METKREGFDARREQAGMLELLGTLDFDETYDYKAERTRTHEVPA